MNNIIDSMVHDCIATHLPKKGPFPAISIDWGETRLSRTEFEYLEGRLDCTTYPSGKIILQGTERLLL